MTYYVKRVKQETGRVGYVGPIRSERQATRERDAWETSGGFSAEILPSTPETRAEVRAWQKRVREERSR